MFLCVHHIFVHSASFHFSGPACEGVRLEEVVNGCESVTQQQINVDNFFVFFS